MNGSVAVSADGSRLPQRSSSPVAVRHSFARLNRVTTVPATSGCALSSVCRGIPSGEISRFWTIGPWMSYRPHRPKAARE